MTDLQANTVYSARSQSRAHPQQLEFVFTTRAGALPDRLARSGAAETSSRAERLDRAIRTEGAVQILRQVHGRELALSSSPTVEPKADAWILDQPINEAYAIRTADCLPVVLFDSAHGSAALVHCGHRGLSGRILEKAASALCVREGSRLDAWLGPCIGPCCYQVQLDVARHFQAVPGALTDHPLQGWYLDLRAVAQAQLEELGVPTRGVVPDCTFCSPERYHSYRRDGRTGGLQSVTAILGVAP